MDTVNLDCLKDIYLWNEIKMMFENLKYSPYGSSTIEIPYFHRENLKTISQNLSPEEFQYNLNNDHLITSLVDNFQKILGVEFNKKQVIITPGAVKGIHSILSTFIDLQNDEIVIFQPFYTCHSTELMFRNFKGFKVINRKPDFSIDFDDLKSKLSERTKFLIIINPDNPTTHVHSNEELMKLTEVLEEYPQVKVIEDMAYFVYLRKNKSLKPFYTIKNNNQKTFMVFSGGKLFNCTGIRCGWTIGPADLIFQLRSTIQINFLFTSPIDSNVICENIKSSVERYEGSKNFYEWVIKDQNERFDYVCKIFDEFNIKYIDPDGTYYMIIDVENFRDNLPEKYYYSLQDEKMYIKHLDKAFCRMLGEKSIGLLPLSALQVGDEEKKIDNFIRISCNRKYEDLDLIREALFKLREQKYIN